MLEYWGTCDCDDDVKGRESFLQELGFILDMATDALPAITLTDPNNLDQAPSPAQSPTKESDFGDLNARVRPGTPSNNAKSGHGMEIHKVRYGKEDWANIDHRPDRLERWQRQHMAFTRSSDAVVVQQRTSSHAKHDSNIYS